MNILIEILGYLGMIITLYAFTKKEQTLRKLMVVGAILTTINCIANGNVPVAILNGALAIMNAVYLGRYRYGSKG